MSVTAKRGSARAAGSRNAILFAEWEASELEHEAWAREHPETAASFARLADALNGGKALSDDERRADSLAHFADQTSMWCSRCRAEFAAGDVVHRKRAAGNSTPWGASWSLEAVCEKCVREEMHPSWYEHRRDPIPCAGGCGVLVSHWYDDRWSTRDRDFVPAIVTCSRRCTDRVQVERRRAKPDARRCGVCGAEFTPKRSDARYCSNACRQDAYRQRKHGGEPGA